MAESILISRLGITSTADAAGKQRNRKSRMQAVVSCKQANAAESSRHELHATIGCCPLNYPPPCSRLRPLNYHCGLQQHAAMVEADLDQSTGVGKLPLLLLSPVSLAWVPAWLPPADLPLLYRLCLLPLRTQRPSSSPALSCGLLLSPTKASTVVFGRRATRHILNRRPAWDAWSAGRAVLNHAWWCGHIAPFAPLPPRLGCASTAPLHNPVSTGSSADPHTLTNTLRPNPNISRLALTP